MTKIKFDLSGSDPEKARAGTGEPPKPGVYDAVVKEINPGFSKDEKSGQPDKERPRLEVIFSITDDRHKGFPMWLYLTFGESALWKYDQFLQAYGIVNDKKRKGEWDTNQVVGKPCKLRVRGGVGQDGQTYRPEVAAVLPIGASDDPDDFSDSLGDAEELGGDDEVVDEPDGDLLTEESLNALSKPDIAAVAKEMGVPYSGKRKAEVVAAILEKQQEAIVEGGGDEDVLGDDDDMLDDEPVDGPTGHTEDELKAMEVPELKEVAKTLDISVKGKTKGAVIAEIMEKEAAGTPDAGSDDTPW
jgi:hypothetical protein